MSVPRLCSLMVVLSIGLAQVQGASLTDLERAVAAIPVRLVSLGDPGYIELELMDGCRIDTVYGEVDHDRLAALEPPRGSEKQAWPEMHMSWTAADGVRLRHGASGLAFDLIGRIEPHPIDLAIERLGQAKLTTFARAMLHVAAARAWDAELNPVYARLGGADKPALRDAQRAWIDFRDAEWRQLDANYSAKEGTIWRIVVQDRKAAVVRARVLHLQDVLSW